MGDLYASEDDICLKAENCGTHGGYAVLKRVGGNSFPTSAGLLAGQRSNERRRAAVCERPYCLRSRAPGWHGVTPLALVVNTTGW